MLIPKPKRVIRIALTIGNPFTHRTRAGSRSNSRLELTSSNPNPVKVAASPKLKANTSISPEPIWPIAIALSSNTKAEGHGTKPPEIPKASRLRQVTGDPSAPGGKWE
jgi:hypothetical protein